MGLEGVIWIAFFYLHSELLVGRFSFPNFFYDDTRVPHISNWKIYILPTQGHSDIQAAGNLCHSCYRPNQCNPLESDLCWELIPNIV